MLFRRVGGLEAHFLGNFGAGGGEARFLLVVLDVGQNFSLTRCEILHVITAFGERMRL